MDSDIEGRVRAFWDEAFNDRDLDLIDAITAPEFVNHNAPWRQCHLYRFDEHGRAVEHDAIRDDASLLRQFADGATGPGGGRPARPGSIVR